MENETIELNIQLTESDYYNFLKANYKARGIYANVWIFGSYAVLMFIISLITGIVSGSFSFFSFVPLVVFGGIVFAVFYELKTKSKKYFRNDATINKPYTLFVNEDGLELKSEQSYWKLRWKELYSFMVTPGGILIYTSPVKALIIPERYLLTATQIEVVSNLLHEHVNVSGIDKSLRTKIYIRIGILVAVILYVAIMFYRAMYGNL